MSACTLLSVGWFFTPMAVIANEAVTAVGFACAVRVEWLV
jgi:hypothetical protein